MANSSQTYRVFDPSPTTIERGDMLDASKIQNGSYKRFRFTESGISPRVTLGTKGAVHWYTGDEHNEVGHISEEPSNRRAMMDKRMKRLELIDKEVPPDEKLNFFGDKNAKNIIVSWGSPKGAIIEAMELLAKEAFSLGFIQVRMLHPLPKAHMTDLLKDREKIIDVENNYLGQLGQIIKEEIGVQPNYRVLKYTGRPITTTEMYDSLKNILTGQTAERQVLTYGS
jgi:2-oxoglutarate ferredoxin oxidoreductase subunit alpha